MILEDLKVLRVMKPVNATAKVTLTTFNAAVAKKVFIISQDVKNAIAILTASFNPLLVCHKKCFTF